MSALAPASRQSVASRMLKTLVSALIWLQIILIVLLWTAVVTTVFLITLPVDRVRYHAGRLCRIGRILLVKVNPFWRVRISGHPIAKDHPPYILVSNHESIADIPLLSHLPIEMKWLSKSSNFRIPFLGWMMSMGGDIPLKRGDKDSASGALERCCWYLQRKTSVIVFPEGTRSQDGDLGQFKEGAFRLAIETGAPLLPVLVCGTREAVIKGSLLFNPNSAMWAHVLPPIETRGLTMADLGPLKNRVRELMRAARNELRRERAASGLTS